jgi:hypothetical protein
MVPLVGPGITGFLGWSSRLIAGKALLFIRGNAWKFNNILLKKYRVHANG